MKGDTIFNQELKKLNPAQWEAVETIEGPVMVIAGPGTGKTQVLALRIGNILQQTDTPADGVLCLTFTNSGVSAMKKRLREYGLDVSKVVVSTFHAFGTRLTEEFYGHLDLSAPPRTLDEADAVSLVDEILSGHDWEHLRPRSDATRYFRDLKSLVSVLIRERLSPEDFGKEIDKDIKRLKSDPESKSTRGATKGELKKEIVNKIESLERSREVAEFYRLYEEAKREQNLFDYDDILRAMVRLVREFEDVRATLRERHLYVLVDEHQDSSGIQNEFLQAVWGPVEKPNVFVVGDDRQLIYGFSGASLSHFEAFRASFPGTKLITLTENYRSTQVILDTAESLLTSHLATGKLSSNRKGKEPVTLVECSYPRDEVLRAGLFFKERIAAGLAPEACALLVPKNAHVRTAVRILTDLGLPVSAPGATKLFESAEFASFRRVLKVIADPFASPEIAELALDPISGIAPLEAHRFIHKTYSRDLSVDALVKAGFEWGKKLAVALEETKGRSPYEMIQYVGKHFFLAETETHAAFIRRVEVVRTLLHLALTLEEKQRGKKVDLRAFLAYLERLEEYGEDVPLALFGEEQGIRVMTLHSSKGLEFEVIWIAHLNERALMSGKRMGLALPERLHVMEEKKDEAAAKREVYVAMTRAKQLLVLSYAHFSHSGGEESLASVVETLPKADFILETLAESEAKILAAGPLKLVTSEAVSTPTLTRTALAELVREEYHKKKVSATTLNCFYECPWKWYFRAFLDVPEPEAEALTFGSVVHTAIESLIKLERAPKKKDLEAAIAAALTERRVIEPSLVRRMTRDALKVLENFATNLLPKLWDEREIERRISVKDKRLPELTITGAIDLMEHDSGGAVRVTDFKTGRPKLAREIEKEDEEGRMSAYLRQLAMYSYLLVQGGKGQYEVASSRLYFAEGNEKEAFYDTTISQDHLGLLWQDIKDYDTALKKGTWIERPCYHKAYPGEMECPYCAKAEMINKSESAV